MENRSKKTKKMVYNGFIMAIIIIMSLVPFLGFIQVPPIAVTLVHIPVIIGAILLVFFVLLVTDILGLTKVFPFTRSIR